MKAEILIQREKYGILQMWELSHAVSGRIFAEECMVHIKEFMEKNNLVFLVEVDANENMFHIHKTDKELQSYDLFEQLILFSNTEKLVQYTYGQLLPRIWTQGDTKCVICKPNDEKIVCAFYDSQLDAKEHYFFAKNLNDELSTLYTFMVM